MTQPTYYQLPNEAGLAFRQHLNENLYGQQSDFAGGTAPTETQPYMRWLDTSTTPSTIRRRSSDNLSWGADNILVENVDIGGGRTQADKNAEFFSVNDSGAVGDGNYLTGSGTDNADAFELAISNLSAAGGTSLRIPSGIYKLGRSIAIPSGISIIGDGKWSTILFCPSGFADANGLLNINGSGGYPTNISGIGVLAQTGGAGGIGIRSVKNGVFIRDVWVNGFTSSAGIYLGNTDNFLYDFVAEQSKYGVYVDSPGITIENGTTHNNLEIGVVVAKAGAASAENGPVHISNIRDNISVQCGLYITGANNVKVNQFSSFAENQDRYNVGFASGIKAINSTNIEFVGCETRIHSGKLTSAVGLHLSTCADVSVIGGEYKNFNIGVYADQCSNVIIDGVKAISNYAAGIRAQGGDRVSINSCNAIGNGNATEGYGIYSANTDAYALHSITSNICTQTGGGFQDYGIYLSVTDNGASSGFTNVVGNTVRFNAISQISKNGLIANINDVGNY